ncbi:MAG: protein phosphatase 2C domain-containing protein [Deltaproteobacteria bacterium]|nr:protein phosphatase 2C domain-containing protein [Deltaproteobacteria bacterium]
MVRTHVGAATLTNTKGFPNQDRYRLLGGEVPLVAREPRGHVFAVVDGVGGAPRGGEAAGAVVDVLARFFDPAIPLEAAGLLQILRAVDVAIKAWGDIDGTDRPLGAAAASIAWLAPDARLHVFHAGDTRALLIDGDDVTRLTGDDGGGALRNYFGVGRVLIEHVVHPLEDGVTLCLVTDGVTKVMDDAEIARATVGRRAPEAAAREVVQRARGKRGVDDITCVVVDVEVPEAEAPTNWRDD